MIAMSESHPPSTDHAGHDSPEAIKQHVKVYLLIGAALLLGTGLLGLVALRRRKQASIEGFGRKSLIDIKKKLRALGYELPEAVETPAA